MKTGIVWLRRDLRLDDNVALAEAARECERLCVAFVIHPPLLRDRRMGAPLVASFFVALSALRDALRERGSDLAILTGDFASELLSLARRIGAESVFFNEDYEPSAVRRDEAVAGTLHRAGIKTRRFTDHVYFGADRVVRANGEPYRVFGAYRRRWLEMRAAEPQFPRQSARAIRSQLMAADAIPCPGELPSPAEFGYSFGERVWHVSEEKAKARLRSFLSSDIFRYAQQRDYPAKNATSELSADLRAGTLGIRTCVEGAFACLRDAPDRAAVAAWIDQLIWRDFYQQILKHFPHVEQESFLPRMDRVAWRQPSDDLDAWCAGQTGYPIVDAAMRQLNTTGWMHNRLRMITASFLTKHLLIDWREGELYFAKRLRDADLAQNNGGWQWAASTGTDAAPYFRVFNPIAQGKRFDPDGAFVRRYIPELSHVPTRFVHEPWLCSSMATGYPPPIVEHRFARQRALDAFTLR